MELIVTPLEPQRVDEAARIIHRSLTSGGYSQRWETERSRQKYRIAAEELLEAVDRGLI